MSVISPNKCSEIQTSLVQEVLNRHLSTPGKMLRPKLFSKLGDLLGLAHDEYNYICKASELIHNATLIHDDVVDEAKIRRGLPTLNAKLTNAQAVLAGDFLLASVISELVKLKKFDDLKTLAETLEQIVEGELLQDSLKMKETIVFKDLEEVSIKKTAALLAWGCGAIARSTGKGDDLSINCIKLGTKIGLAFQMIDDNLDYSLESGKSYAKDLQEGLINFTTLNLIKIYPELLYPIYQLRGKKLQTPPWNSNQMNDAIKETKNDADAIFEEIYDLLEDIATVAGVSKSEPTYSDLKKFLEKLQERRQ